MGTERGTKKGMQDLKIGGGSETIMLKRSWPF